MKIFMTYYILSGFGMAICAHRNYDEIIEEMPIAGYVNKDILIFIQFLTGFLQLPIVCILLVQRLFLDLKIARLEKRNKRLKDKIELNKIVFSESMEAKALLSPNIHIEGFASEADIYIHTISKTEISIGNYIAALSWVIIHHEEAKCLNMYYIIIKDKLIAFCVEETLKYYIKNKWIVTATIENPYHKPETDK